MSRTLLLAALLTGAGVAGSQDAEPAPNVIHVDERCRIVTEDRPNDHSPYSRPRYRNDKTICHFESEHRSHHWEQKLANGVIQRTYVEVVEREYVLHDPTLQPLVFLVDQSVPSGWTIDSDPQPIEVIDQVAVFRVVAQPGQTIRLHVGERH